MAVEYREETPAGWSDTVARTWTVTERDGGYVLAGRCPTCDDECSVDVDLVTALPGQATERKGLGDGPERLVVVCNCDGAHPNRPVGLSGCGRGGHLALHTT